MTPNPGALYVHTEEQARGLVERLTQAGIPPLAPRPVDLLDEGLTLSSKAAFRIDVDPAHMEDALEVLQVAAPELLAEIGDVNPIVKALDMPNDPEEEGADVPPELAARWRSDASTLRADLFGDDEEKGELALEWIVGPGEVEASFLAELIVDACRRDRDDLVGPLARMILPIVPDPVVPDRLYQHKSHVRETPLPETKGFCDLLAGLQLLASDPAEAVRCNFCVAAGCVASAGLLPELVKLLEDPAEDVRYEAITALYNLVGKDFDFDSEDGPEKRALAAIRGREWLDRREQ